MTYTLKRELGLLMEHSIHDNSKKNIYMFTPSSNIQLNKCSVSDVGLDRERGSPL